MNAAVNDQVFRHVLSRGMASVCSAGPVEDLQLEAHRRLRARSTDSTVTEGAASAKSNLTCGDFPPRGPASNRRIHEERCTASNLGYPNAPKSTLYRSNTFASI